MRIKKNAKEAPQQDLQMEKKKEIKKKKKALQQKRKQKKKKKKKKKDNLGNGRKELLRMHLTRT